MTAASTTAARAGGGCRALIVVDVQNDFCDAGSLPVPGGSALAGAIAEHLAQHADRYRYVVATADWHIDPGTHFSDHPDYQHSWPAHCVAGTVGAEFHPALSSLPERVDAVFRKGEYSAAYSGFEGFAVGGRSPVALADWLAERAVDQVDVVGLATDHCVRATALDAVRAGLSTRLLRHLSAGVTPDSTRAALAQMAAAGVEFG